MTRAEALRDATAQLTAQGALDAALDAQWMMADVVGLPRLQLLLERAQPLTQAQWERYQGLLTRRLTGEPLQYVLGTQDFMGHSFCVDARVLIPRQDTETLCEAAIARIGLRAASVLDIGTGSGALAVSIALACPHAHVSAVDISMDALAVARENAERLGANVRFDPSDLCCALDGQRFDVIVSNPPYVQRNALPYLQREVQREPLLALDGGRDGLDYYRVLAVQLPAHLVAGGVCLLEVGEGQDMSVRMLLEERLERSFVVEDLRGVARVVGAYRKM